MPINKIYGCMIRDLWLHDTASVNEIFTLVASFGTAQTISKVTEVALPIFTPFYLMFGDSNFLFLSGPLL